MIQPKLAQEEALCWAPGTDEDREIVRKELTSILASSQFCNSKRYPALLQYIVEQTLEGCGDLVKERTLGVEVFHRKPSYDTSEDTIVRYTAGEVRRRLSLYYLEHTSPYGLHIVLPTGTYIPIFLRAAPESAPHPLPETAFDSSPDTPTDSIQQTPSKSRLKFAIKWLVPICALLVILAGAFQLYSAHKSQSLDTFWTPVLDSREIVLICPGIVVTTASAAHAGSVALAEKSAEYPFLTMEMAAAVTRTANILQSHGVAYHVQPSAQTTLTDIRERPIIMMGLYNNEWTKRLLDNLRFQLAPVEGIFDAYDPHRSWTRDHSIPYSESTDYAIIALVHDNKITGGPVVVIGGLGRNGTEGASQFVTTPQYLDMLNKSVGGNWRNKNIEVVLKVPVIDSKTGPPSIEAVQVW